MITLTIQQYTNVTWIHEELIPYTRTYQLLLETNNGPPFFVHKSYTHRYMSQSPEGPPATKAQATSQDVCTTYGMEPDLGHAIPVQKDFRRNSNPRSLKRWPRYTPFGPTAYTTSNFWSMTNIRVPLVSILGQLQTSRARYSIPPSTLNIFPPKATIPSFWPVGQNSHDIPCFLLP